MIFFKVKSSSLLFTLFPGNSMCLCSKQGWVGSKVTWLPGARGQLSDLEAAMGSALLVKYLHIQSVFFIVSSRLSRCVSAYHGPALLGYAESSKRKEIQDHGWRSLQRTGNNLSWLNRRLNQKLSSRLGQTMIGSVCLVA